MKGQNEDFYGTDSVSKAVELSIKCTIGTFENLP